MLRLLVILSGFVLLAAACSGSAVQPDAGPADSGVAGGLDAGTPSGSCASEGQACDPVLNPCCTVTCPDGVTQLVTQSCEPGSLICLPVIQIDGGVPSCPVTPDGGTSSGGLPAVPDCAVWRVETSLAGIAALNGLAAPSPALLIAVGTGAGEGQLLAPLDAGAAPGPADGGGLYPPDGGVCAPFDAGPPATWSALAGVPASGALNGVWADASGDLFAAGRSVAGTGLLLAGNLDGGLHAVALSGVPATLSLTSVLGLGPAEALAGGFTPAGQPVLLHLTPDGGLSTEALPAAGLTQVDKLAGSAAGPIYALALDDNQDSQVLERTDGGWLLLAPPSTEGLSNPVIANLALGPEGALWVVGSDGSGDGLAFAYEDGGFVQLDLYDSFGDVAPIGAAYAAPDGELFLAAVPQQPNALLQTPQMLHYSGGAAGFWDYERLPEETLALNAIAGDGAGNLYAVGGQEGVTLDPNPDAGGVASVPLVLRRVVP